MAATLVTPNQSLYGIPEELFEGYTSEQIMEIKEVGGWEKWIEIQGLLNLPVPKDPNKALLNPSPKDPLIQYDVPDGGLQEFSFRKK